MLTVFFDFRGEVHYEFLPPCQTVNKKYFLSAKRRLREAIRLKRPELWGNNSWVLHHDNAPSHTVLILRDHFVKNSKHIVPQPPYSPDLAPCDFWLFPKLKRPLRGTRFESIDEIKLNRKRRWWLYRKRTIWHVSRIGKFVGISIFHREGITLKGIQLIYNNK